MKLNKDAIKNVLNYISEKQTFDFEDGYMSKIYLTGIVNDLAGDDETKKQETACAIVRCINEGLVYSDYPRNMWFKATITDISFIGFKWLEEH